MHARTYVAMQLAIAIYSLVSRGQTLLRRALSIRDDKRPREKGLVQVQYQTRSLTPSPSRGVNK